MSKIETFLLSLDIIHRRNNLQQEEFTKKALATENKRLQLGSGGAYGSSETEFNEC